MAHEVIIKPRAKIVVKPKDVVYAVKVKNIKKEE